MQFVMPYSCGKDSALALHRMVQKGHVPVALLVMVNRELGRSWFHGVDRDLLGEVSDALGIPLFRRPVRVAVGEVLEFGEISAVDLMLDMPSRR